MKKFIFLFLLGSTMYAQNGFNYKAIISENGNILQNQMVDVQFSILQDATTLYLEEQTTETDTNGILILNIGEGTYISGTTPDFNQIPWGELLDLKVEINTGNGYTDLGITQLKDVPRAKYAAVAGNVFSGSFSDLTNVPFGLADGDDDTQLTETQVDNFVANNGYLTSENDGDPTNELQTLSVSGTLLTISNGNTVTLPTGSSGDQWGSQVVESNASLTGDGTSTNPLAVDTNSSDFNNWDKNATDDFSGSFTDLTNVPSGLADGDDDTQLTETQVDNFVANNGYLITEIDGSITNELQTISKSGNTVTLSNGGGNFTDTDTQLTETQVDNFVANNGYLTSENDGDPINELQTLSVSGTLLTISNGNTVTLPTGSSGDQWGSQVVESNASLTGDGTSTNPLAVDTNSSDFNNWDKNATDDFSGSFTDLTNVPTGLADGDDDTQLTETQVDDYVGNNGYATELNELIDAKTGGYSIFIGTDAGLNDDGTNNNMGIGYQSLQANTTGYNNTATGNFSLKANTTGFNNTANGYLSLKSNTTGNYNTANGYYSLESNTTGNHNTAIGFLSLQENTTGSYNTAIGSDAGHNNTGQKNIFLGYKAGYNETGSDKLYIENSNSSTPLIGGDFSTDEVTINGILQVTGGTPGTGKIFTSDANGKGSWETPVDNDTQLTETQVDNFVANNGYLTTEVDGSTTNELQTLSISGNVLSISDGNNVTLGSDVDFLEVGTGAAPDNILDNIYHTGNISVGHTTTPNAKLDIQNSGTSTAINANTGIKITNTNSSNTDKIGVNTSLYATGTAKVYGTKNYLLDNGDGDMYGTHTTIGGLNGNGDHYGNYLNLTGEGTGIHTGSKTNLSTNGNAIQTGNDIEIYTVTNASTAVQTGVKTHIYGDGTGDKYGVTNLIDGNADGNLYGTENTISNTNDSYAHYGTINRMQGSGNGSHFGTSNITTGVGEGKQYGVRNYNSNSGNNKHYGVYSKLNGAGSGIHIGANNLLQGDGTGEQVAVLNEVSNTSGAVHYGVKNMMTGTGSGIHYGNYSELNGTGTGHQTGAYYEINNTGSGVHTGVKAILNGTGTNSQTGLHTEINNTGDGYQYGVLSIVDNSGNGQHTAVAGTLRGTGTGTQYGIKSTVSNSGSGDHYGNYIELTGSGSGDKYGVYAKIPTTAGGIHYAIYGEAENLNNYAGYFKGFVKITGVTTTEHISMTSSYNSGKTARRYGPGTADMLAYVYGNIDAYYIGGEIIEESSSFGFTMDRLSQGRYEITIGNTGSADNYLVQVTLNELGVAWVDSKTASSFVVNTKDGFGSSDWEDLDFQFVVYKK